MRNRRGKKIARLTYEICPSPRVAANNGVELREINRLTLNLLTEPSRVLAPALISAGLNKPSVLFKYLFAGNYSRWLNKFYYDFPIDLISASFEALSVGKRVDKKSPPADFTLTPFHLA